MNNITFKMHYLEFITLTFLAMFFNTQYIVLALFFAFVALALITLAKLYTGYAYKFQIWTIVICFVLIFGFYQFVSITWAINALILLLMQFTTLPK